MHRYWSKTSYRARNYYTSRTDREILSKILLAIPYVLAHTFHFQQLRPDRIFRLDPAKAILSI